MGVRTINIQPALDSVNAMREALRNFSPPRWAGPLYQPIPSTFRKCVWCKDHLPVFGPLSVNLGEGWAHQECADAAERFALKSSIRHRTNPTTGYFPGWRTR